MSNNNNNNNNNNNTNNNNTNNNDIFTITADDYKLGDRFRAAFPLIFRSHLEALKRSTSLEEYKDNDFDYESKDGKEYIFPKMYDLLNFGFSEEERKKYNFTKADTLKLEGLFKEMEILLNVKNCKEVKGNTDKIKQIFADVLSREKNREALRKMFTDAVKNNKNFEKEIDISTGKKILSYFMMVFLFFPGYFLKKTFEEDKINEKIAKICDNLSNELTKAEALTIPGEAYYSFSSDDKLCPLLYSFGKLEGKTDLKGGTRLNVMDENGKPLSKLDASKIRPCPYSDTKQAAQETLNTINDRYKDLLKKINNAYPEINLQQTQQNKTPVK